MAPSRRRISYVIPPPTDAVQQLQLPPYAIPRNGAVGPLLLSSQKNTPDESPKGTRHPRHRLGVVSLALDTSTQLAGKDAPEGILYSGARDGLVCSWDLELPMKRRESITSLEGQRKSAGRWEAMTGWGDDVIDEEGEDGEEKLRMDGDVLGEVHSPRLKRRRTVGDGTIPYEFQWETDLDAYQPGKPTQFRQCSQTHTDWVNDLLLCNYNQTVVSASSDGSIKAWSPHSANLPDPSVIGTHTDYVRCLASCREQQWVASGSFDRTIKLWDISRSEPSHTPEPLITLNPPDANAPKSSIYAIAADPFGHAIASGSPERVVRMWDPRSGKRTAKLVGHTDNIRAILISEDSRYLLTGSADASIKLWSLASQRCLHTFTYHTDSVWSLFSTHPSLEVFYSGDKTGLVCKVDVEDCSDVAEGECVVVCQDPGERSMASSEGINKIVALDDNVLWTASGSSSIRRWKVPQRRVVRASQLSASDGSDSPVISKRRTTLNSIDSAHAPSRLSTSPTSTRGRSDSLLIGPSMASDLRDREEASLFGIPFESLVRLTSPNDPFTPYAPSSRGRDPEVATMYSAASVASVPRASGMRSPIHFHQPNTLSPSPMRGDVTSRPGTTDDTMNPVHTARADFEERELAADAVPLHTKPDDIIYGDHGLVRSIILNDRLHALTVDISGEVAVWDIVRGICLGRYPRTVVAAASHCGASTTEGSNGSERERSPREALEAVRERIEGEAVVSPWSSVDTKTGVLTVHLNERCFEAEIYADEAGFGPDRRFNDELRLNIGKWVLRNLFLGFIREEQRTRRHRQNSINHEPPNIRKVPASPTAHPNGGLSRNGSSADISNQIQQSAKSNTSTTVVSSAKMVPAISPHPLASAVPTARSSPLLTPLIPIHPIIKDNVPLPSIPQSPPLGSHDVTPMPRYGQGHGRAYTTDGNGAQPPSSPLALTKEGDYFSMRTRQPSTGAVINTPDDFAAWGSGKQQQDGVVIPQTPLTPGGGLMGRLKNFGKAGGKKGPGETGPTSPVAGPAAIPEAKTENSPPPSPDRPKTPQQVLLSGVLTPPSSSEAPSITLPPNIALLLSEEEYPGWKTIYRGTIASTWSDLAALEDAMPMWLLEYLLTNKVPAITVQKISFVLLPWPHEADPLPELLNTSQSKLTASRFLRVRKLTNHVQDKVERIDKIPASPLLQGTPRSSFDAKRPIPSPSSSPYKTSHSPSGPKSEDLYQILCNDIVLPLDMTLAAVRQFVWRQSAELTMYYRRRVVTPVEDAGSTLVARAL